MGVKVYHFFDDVDDMFSSTVYKTRKSRSSGGTAHTPQLRPKTSRTPKMAYAGRKTNQGVAKATAQKYQAASKPKEVMVKISGNSKDFGRLKAHAEYISRNGDVTLHDEDGNKINGKEAVKDLVNAWEAGGLIPEKSQGKREVFHIVLSMPAGTDPTSLQKAAKNFVDQEFSGHKYFTAFHHEEDKQGNLKNPHVHVAVAAKDMAGHRLNPRKQDLFNWRVEFAEKCREQGLDAVATRRVNRSKTIEPEKLAMRKWREEAGGNFQKDRKTYKRGSPLQSDKPNKLKAMWEKANLNEWVEHTQLVLNQQRMRTAYAGHGLTDDEINALTAESKEKSPIQKMAEAIKDAKDKGDKTKDTNKTK